MNEPSDAIVIGGGFAGLSAAVRLAGRGAKVLVLEARSRLGGRATAFPDRETGDLVDNGQHVLLGCYSATFAFLREIGAMDRVRLQSQLAVTTIDKRGRRSRLVCPAIVPSPLHLIAGLFEWGALGWGDRWSAVRMARPIGLARRQMAGAPVVAASPGETVDAWLVRNGQTARIREMLWHPLCLAALNQPAEVAAAPVFARVLAEMFGPDSSAAAIGLPDAPLSVMYAEPARAYLEAHGCLVRTGAAARIQVDGRRCRVESGEQTWQARSTIVAVPWFALPDVCDRRSAALADIADRASRTKPSPIVTVNLWFDRPVMDEPFIGLPGRSMQWAFEQAGPADGALSHVSLVSSGAAPLLERTNEQLVSDAHAELIDAIPAARAARLVRGTVVREPRATFSLAPGQPQRPGTVTPVPGVFLAGDWIDTGLPATIESAVRSGHLAADAALASTTT